MESDIFYLHASNDTSHGNFYYQPQQVGWQGWVNSARVIITIVAVWLIFILMGSIIYYQALYYTQNGVPTILTIENCFENTTGSSRNAQILANIAGRLNVNNQELTVEKQISGRCANYALSSQHAVLYVADDRRFEFGTPQSLILNPIPPILLLIALAVTAYGIHTLNRQRPSYARWRRLQSKGVVCNGKITLVTQEQRKKGFGITFPVLVLRYKFLTSRQKTLSAVVEITYRQEKNRKVLVETKNIYPAYNAISGFQSKDTKPMVKYDPKPGTPVHVLYADDHTFVLL